MIIGLSVNQETTCIFYLNNRTKTITDKFAQDCWITFKNDFGEAISELVKVKVIDSENNEHHLKPRDFFQLYVTPEKR